MPMTDQEILTRIRRGDRNAFGQLVEKYKAAVFAVALHYTRNEQDAEDVAQEILLKAYTHLATLRDEDKFAPWLFRIAQTTCLNWKRARARQRERPAGAIPDGASEISVTGRQAHAKSPDELLEAKELSAFVMRALDVLSETTRLTTMMYYMDGLTYREIAELQGVSVSAVKGRLYHARRQLRRGVMSVMASTLKQKVPGVEFTEAILKNLETVHQPLGEGAATLIAKDERAGMIHHTALADVNGDGQAEILVGTDKGIAMAFAPSGEVLWRYICPGPVTALQVREDRIFVGSQELVALDGAGNVCWQVSTGEVKSLALGELPDGGYEIVVLTKHLQVLNPEGKVLAEFSDGSLPDGCGCGCQGGLLEIAVGDADGDGLYEIGASSSESLYLFRRDGVCLWSVTSRECAFDTVHSDSWYGPIALVDINGDGKAELLAGLYQWLVAFNGEGRELWRCRGPAALRCLATGDIDGDGNREIAAGSTSWEVDVISGEGQLLWQYPIGSWISSVAMADIDDDGQDEILVGGMHKSGDVFALNGDGELLWRYPIGYEVCPLSCGKFDSEVAVVAGADDMHLITSTGKRRWVYRSGGDFKVAAADLDGDGVAEILAASSVVTAYKDNGEALWTCDTGHVWDLAVGAGPEASIAVGCARNRAYRIDGNGQTRWQRDLKWIRSSVLVADVDGDGSEEVLVADNTTLYLFDASGEERWRFQHRYERITSHLLCLAVGNLTGSGLPSIVAGFQSGPFALSAEGEVLWNYLEPLPEDEREGWRIYNQLVPNSIAVADLNGDGFDEIVLLTARGLYCFSHDGRVLWHRDAPTARRTFGKTHLLQCADLNGDGVPEIVCAAGGISAYDGSGDVLWETDTHGEATHVVVGDVDDDGHPEVIVADDELEVFAWDGLFKFRSTGFGPITRVALGDVNGDGRLEILAGGAGVYVITCYREKHSREDNVCRTTQNK